MNISPQTNISSPVHSEQRTVTTTQTTNNSSSKDLASVSTTPAVKVALSVSENAQAASNTTVPQLYSRISVAKNNQEQLYVDDDQRAAPFEDEQVERRESADDPEVEVRSGPQDQEDQEAGDESSVDQDSSEVVTASADRESSDQGRAEAQQEKLEQEQIAELKARDQEVRAHEQAHKAAGGQYASSASFTYQAGPDGVRYAVGGEVQIDVSPIPNDPQATIAKMNIVKAAANAPAEPSAQDRAVAAEAQRIITQAQAEIAQEQRNEVEQAKIQAQEKREAQEEEEEQSEARRAERESQNLSVQEFQRIAELDPNSASDIDALV